MWLKSTLKVLVCSPEAKDFIQSFREGSKAFIVQRGSNRSNQYFEVGVYVVGGRRGLIVIPEGREGWGWSGFAAEQKGDGFFRFSKRQG